MKWNRWVSIPSVVPEHFYLHLKVSQSRDVSHSWLNSRQSVLFLHLPVPGLLASFDRKTLKLFHKAQEQSLESVFCLPPRGNFQGKYSHFELPMELHIRLKRAGQIASASVLSMSLRRQAHWGHSIVSSLFRIPSCILYFQLLHASLQKLYSHRQYLKQFCKKALSSLLDFMSNKAQTSLMFDFFWSTALRSVD